MVSYLRLTTGVHGMWKPFAIDGLILHVFLRGPIWYYADVQKTDRPKLRLIVYPESKQIGRHGVPVIRGTVMKKRLIPPVLIILVGVAWLLNAEKVIPGVDWVWTIGLAATGICTMLLGGYNRMTLVIGPFLLIASVTSVLRQTALLSVDTEIPVLTIVLGSMWLIVSLLKLPMPESFQVEHTQQ